MILKIVCIIGFVVVLYLLYQAWVAGKAAGAV